MGVTPSTPPRGLICLQCEFENVAKMLTYISFFEEQRDIALRDDQFVLFLLKVILSISGT